MPTSDLNLMLMVLSAFSSSDIAENGLRIIFSA
jgi:hypothetical protein